MTTRAALSRKRSSASSSTDEKENEDQAPRKKQSTTRRGADDKKNAKSSGLRAPRIRRGGTNAAGGVGGAAAGGGGKKLKVEGKGAAAATAAAVAPSSVKIAFDDPEPASSSSSSSGAGGAGGAGAAGGGDAVMVAAPGLVDVIGEHGTKFEEATAYLESMPKRPKKARTFADYKAKCDQQLGMIKSLKSHLQATMEERTELEAALEEVGAAWTAEAGKGAKAAADMGARLQTAADAAAATKRDLRSLEEKRAALEKDLAVVSDRERELVARVACLEKDLQASEEAKAAQATAMGEVEAARDAASADLATCRDELAAASEAHKGEVAAAAEAAKADKEQALEAARAEHDAAAAAAASSHSTEQAEQRAKLEAIQKESQEFQVQIKVLTTRAETHGADKEQLTAAAAKAERERDQMETRCKEMGEEIKGIQTKLAQKEAELSDGLKSFSSAQKWHQDRAEQLEKDKAVLQQRADELKAEGERGGQAHKELEAQLQQCGTELAEARQRLTAAEAQHGEAKAAHDQLQAEAAAAGEEIAALNAAVSGLRGEVQACKEAAERQEVAARQERDQIAAAMQAKEALLQAEKAHADKTNEDLRQANGTLTSALAAANEQGECLSVELRSLRSNMQSRPSAQVEKLAEAEVENERLKIKVQQAMAVKDDLTSANEEIARLEQKLRESEKMRRSLHNKVQDLRGNVRIYVRTRPMLSPGAGGGGGGSSSSSSSAAGGAAPACPVKCLADGETVRLVREAQEGGRKPQQNSFKFDKVFAGSSTQQQVFDEISELIQSVLDGYKVCIFSYGQTGSGKTFTMSGSSASPELRGLIPRSVERIFAAVGELAPDGWSHKLSVSFIEIYNEKIMDMLADAPCAAAGGLPIRVPSRGGPYVEGLTKEPISQASDIHRLMAKAERTRAVAATDMNARSSRSHTICVLNVEAVHEEQGLKLRGCLNLCDLAGSERLSKSHAEGARLKETQAINTSLKSLSDVFHALSQKAGHVPYRNSKLTHVLQECLGGDGKAAMLVALSPDPTSANETLQSLRFAEKVKSTELGQAKRSVSKRS